MERATATIDRSPTIFTAPLLAPAGTAPLARLDLYPLLSVAPASASSLAAAVGFGFLDRPPSVVVRRPRCRTGTRGILTTLTLALTNAARGSRRGRWRALQRNRTALNSSSAYPGTAWVWCRTSKRRCPRDTTNGLRADTRRSGLVGCVSVGGGRNLAVAGNDESTAVGHDGMSIGAQGVEGETTFLEWGGGGQSRDEGGGFFCLLQKCNAEDGTVSSRELRCSPVRFSPGECLKTGNSDTRAIKTRLQGRHGVVTGYVCTETQAKHRPPPSRIYFTFTKKTFHGRM